MRVVRVRVYFIYLYTTHNIVHARLVLSIQTRELFSKYAKEAEKWNTTILPRTSVYGKTIVHAGRRQAISSTMLQEGLHGRFVEYILFTHIIAGGV